MPPMALFLSLFLSLLGGPPPDTPGGPIVQAVPVVHMAALGRAGALQA